MRCRSVHLLRGFAVIMVMAGYIPPDANAHIAVGELSRAVSSYQNSHPSTSASPGVYQPEPGMTKEVKAPLRQRDVAFRSGDGVQYSAARADLKRVVHDQRGQDSRQKEGLGPLQRQ